MDYRIHLKQFDGPLDLLLHLVEKAEVDIKDIFISEITFMFLEYLNDLDELDMDQASDFLGVASTLVYMKSRSLFPPAPKEEESMEDTGELLVRQLQQYKAFKRISETLRQLANDARDMMRTKLPEEFPLPPREIILRDPSVQSLFDAMLRALSRETEPKVEPIVHEVSADVFTIRSCARKIRQELKRNDGETTFGHIIAGAGRMEIIVAFMAMLEMISSGEIRLVQTKYCGEINVYSVNLVENDEKINYMDEMD